MPIPNDERRIDLAVTKGLPSFIDVLENVLTEWRFKNLLSRRDKTNNSTQLKAIKHLIEEHVEIEFIPHSKMKEMLQSPHNKGNIRTGETTPFSNIVLESNVTF